MSTKKSKTKENNENLYPNERKRMRSGHSSDITHSSWKVAKLDTVSSPTSLNAELLEEMGIGMLESDESSSSVASAIALVVSSSNPSADENSNEATPNLDAPKLRNQSYLMLRPANRILDSTIENDNGNLVDSSDSIKIPMCVTNNNNNGSGSSNNHNSKNIEIAKTEKFDVPLNKKVAILGASASSNSIYQLGNSNFSPGKHGRSPLSTVTCNNVPSIAGGVTIISQQLQTNTMNATAIVAPFMRSSPIPSTSQQAASFKQQQLQQQQSIAPLSIVPSDEFFLFRNNLNRCSSGSKNYFQTLSDEIILQIFKWLPKKTLIRCSSVCRSFNRCARDESLWARLDLGGRNLRSGAMEDIVTRGVVILRLAQCELKHPVFETRFLQNDPNFVAKLQYLDLSMVSVTKPSLRMLLSSCTHLKKLSLEHVPINDDICREIAHNVNLEALNLAMCEGLEAWSVRTLLEGLRNLNSLNISWTNLSVEAVTSLVTNAPPSLMRLNVAGCRKTMFNSHLVSLLKRCPNLLELDLSDCAALTSNAINIICKFRMLEYLSLSRCYMIPATSYLELKKLSTLTYLDVFGILSTSAMEMLEENCPNLGLNKFIHSSVARPTVGTRRTSIWGLRTRD